MDPRDLLLHRYWRREDDGSYGMSCICYSLFDKAKRHNLQLGFGFSVQCSVGFMEILHWCFVISSPCS